MVRSIARDTFIGIGVDRSGISFYVCSCRATRALLRAVRNVRLQVGRHHRVPVILFCVGRRVDIGKAVQPFDKIIGGRLNTRQLRSRHAATLDIGRGQLQAFNRDLVVIGAQ